MVKKVTEAYMACDGTMFNSKSNAEIYEKQHRKAVSERELNKVLQHKINDLVCMPIAEDDHERIYYSRLAEQNPNWAEFIKKFVKRLSDNRSYVIQKLNDIEDTKLKLKEVRKE